MDVNFSVARTLPWLKKQFAGDELVFLFGSDVVPGLASWPHADKLLAAGELVVGIRSKDDRQNIRQVVEAWSPMPAAVTIFDSYAPDVSSGKVRQALRRRQKAKGVLTSVERYSNRHWLYVSLA